MTKEQIFELWNSMFNSRNVVKEFTSMVIGRHDKVGDGWRTLILRKENLCIKIILERNPLGYFIYSGDFSFELGKDELYEQMCIDFDKRGTLYEGNEITMERINEIL